MKKIALLFCTLLAALPAAAQTWTGAGPNNNWSTGANWSGGVPPASSPATQLSFPLSPRMSPVVDAPWTINQLNVSANGYAISGQTITFSGAAAGISMATLFGAVSVSNPLVLASPWARSAVREQSRGRLL